MDRRLTQAKITLKKLAIDLITPSELESTTDPKINGIEALQLLGSLEEISRHSMGIKSVATTISRPVSVTLKPNPAPVPRVSHPTKSPTATTSAPRLQRTQVQLNLGYSRNEAYRPALENPDIVYALMGIESEKIAVAPQIRDSRSFRHADLPIVDAQPKTDSRYSRSSGTGTPVLRSE